ncbi:MAG TPA: helix-turn-helix domain-containing protein [Bacteroidota bacterium]|nr:helix-turn-helix domain-containing protein [Bacteroidota bacterium]
MKTELEEINRKLDVLLNLIKEKLPQPLPFKEAAKYLSISESYLYKLVSKGQITGHQPGGKRLFFRAQELNAWAFSNEKKTLEEIKKCA